MTDNKTRLQWAQWMAAKGINVFAVTPNAKRPLEGPSWYIRQSTEADTIAGFFDITENCNYGLHPGDKYVVIDLDVKPQHNGVRAFEAICAENGIDEFTYELDTLMVSTPGGGYHLYFRSPFPCSNRNKFPDGIDVRGVNGYVVGPGSRDGRGEWALIDPDAKIAPLPEWLVEYVVQPGHKDPNRDNPVVDLDIQENIDHALEWLLTRKPSVEGANGDDWTYETAQYMRDFGLSESAALKALNTEWNKRCAPPWDLELLEAKIANAYEYGQNRPGCKSPSWKAQRVVGGHGSDMWAKHLTPEALAEMFRPGSATSSDDYYGAAGMEDVPQGLATDDLLRIILSAASLIDNQKDINEAVVSEDLNLFERGGAVVSLTRLTETEVKDGVRRAVGSYIIGSVNPHVMQYFAMKAATFWKWNERAKTHLETECPKKLVDGYLNNHHVRTLRALHSIAQAPTLRPDGSMLQEPGYDAKSAMFVELRGSFPRVPDSPTRRQAEKALEKVRHVVRGIMFDGKKRMDDRTPTDAESVWLAAVLTSIIRGSIPTAPLFGFSAPTKGSGKTLAADLVGIIATGNDIPAMSIPDSEEELRKTLFSSLLAGDEVVLLDNVKAGVPLKSDALNAILTKSSYGGRVLGASTILTVPVVTTFLATGNNFAVDEDLRRRTLVCHIDPLIENPDQRRFDWDARVETRANRGELVAAVLTIIRAYMVAKEAGDPTTNLELVPYGSFENWDALVRYPLVWIGVPDPANTRKRVNSGDTERTERAFVSAWVALMGDRRVRVRDVVVACGRHYEDETEKENAVALREVLEDITDAPGGGIKNRKIGEWLGGRRGRIIDGKRLESKEGHVLKWRFAEINRD